MDWRQLESLEAAINRNEEISLDREIISYIERTALELNMVPPRDADSTLQFVLDARRRIREGSRRLMRAYGAVQSQRYDEARALIDEILRIETIPLYIEHAQALLRELD